MVHELTEQVSANIDCTLCANCCKTIRPTLTDQDVDRLATRLAISRQELIDKYLEKSVRDPDSPYITRTTPCPFLQDNLCSVYHDRPEACQGYPYLDEPDLRFRMIDMVRGTFTCPIIYEVMEKLKAMTRFRHR